MKLIRFHHKGRLIAVNPDRVAFVEADQTRQDYTYIRFGHHGDGSNAFVQGTVEGVIASLTGIDEKGLCAGRAASNRHPVTRDELISQAAAKIDDLIIERGGRELGEVGLNALHEMLAKLTDDAGRLSG